MAIKILLALGVTLMCASFLLAFTSLLSDRMIKNDGITDRLISAAIILFPFSLVFIFAGLIGVLFTS